MDLSEEEWRVLNAKFHSALKKKTGYRGLKFLESRPQRDEKLDRRPEREKKAPNKLTESDDRTTVLITARIIDWETHLFSIAEDQSPLDTQLIYPSASTLMDVSSELSQ